MEWGRESSQGLQSPSIAAASLLCVCLRKLSLECSSLRDVAHEAVDVKGCYSGCHHQDPAPGSPSTQWLGTRGPPNSKSANPPKPWSCSDPSSTTARR